MGAAGVGGDAKVLVAGVSNNGEADVAGSGAVAGDRINPCSLRDTGANILHFGHLGP